MYAALAIELIEKPGIQTVSSGYTKQFSKDIGCVTRYNFCPARIDPKKYQGHQDSRNQHLLADKRLLVSLFSFDEKKENTALLIELKKLQEKTPIHQIEKLVYTIGFALQNQRNDILDFIIKEATALGVKTQLSEYLRIQALFLQKQQEYVKSGDSKSMLAFIQDNPIDLNLFSKKPLILYAAQSGHEDLIDYLLKQKIPVDTPDDYGFTALFEAAAKGYANIVTKLLDLGANHLGSHSAVTALSHATSGKHHAVVAILLSRDPRSDNDQEKIKDISLAAQTAISKNDEKSLALFLASKCIDFTQIKDYGRQSSVRHLLIPHMEFKYEADTMGATLSQLEKKPQLPIRFLIDDLHLLCEKHLKLTKENEQKEVTAFIKAAEERIVQLESTKDQERFRAAIQTICDSLKIKSEVTKSFEDKLRGDQSLRGYSRITLYDASLNADPVGNIHMGLGLFSRAAPQPQTVDYKIQLRNLNSSLARGGFSPEVLNRFIEVTHPPGERNSFNETELSTIKRNMEEMIRVLHQAQRLRGR